MSEKLPLVPQVARHGSLAGRRNSSAAESHRISVDVASIIVVRAKVLADAMYADQSDGTILALHGELVAALASSFDASFLNALASDGFRPFHDRADTHSSLLH